MTHPQYTSTVTIPLTKGKVTVIDKEDEPLVSGYKWYAAGGKRGTWYAVAKPYGSKAILMHRLIARPGDGEVVDHADGDGLNNTRENLRVTNQSMNLANRGKTKKNKSGYKGVSFTRSSKRWRGTIKAGDKQIHLGYFDSPEEAAKAYDAAALQHFGEFAQVNFPAQN